MEKEKGPFSGSFFDLGGNLGDLELCEWLAMAEAHQIALLRLVLDTLHFIVAAMGEDFGLDSRLLEDRHTDLDAFLITDKQGFQLERRTCFQGEFLYLDLVAFCDFVLFSTCTDYRDHMCHRSKIDT